MLCFHIPLINPDGGFSHPASGQGVTLSPTKQRVRFAQADKPQLPMEIAVGLACGAPPAPPLELVLAAQPLARPL
jgi:hypothetical protein